VSGQEDCRRPLSPRGTTPKKHREEKRTALECSPKARSRRLYEGTQAFITVVIFLNGLLYIIQFTSWNDDCCIENMKAQRMCESIDMVFLAIYTLELCVNLAAHWFCEFWQNHWNKFDVVVISMSWWPFIFSNLRNESGGKTDEESAGTFHMTLFRILRLIRVIGRIEAFRKILNTLKKSIAGIGSLLLMMAGIMTLYAILGVGLFGESSELFFDFGCSLWTLWVVLNGEPWFMILEKLETDNWFIYFYFSSFYVVSGIVVLNMIVAVFIDKMRPSQAEDETSPEADILKAVQSLQREIQEMKNHEFRRWNDEKNSVQSLEVSSRSRSVVVF